MTAPPVAAIDIGSNTSRLLITKGGSDIYRTAVVTGLGRGVARSGRMSEAAIADTVAVLEGFRRMLDEHGVLRARAVATAAARMAANTVELLDRAQTVLGFRPEVIDGTVEARLSYAGATSDLEPTSWTVVDIGGGSTEFISAPDAGVSVDVGSVRLTDLFFEDRPAESGRVHEARRHATELMKGVQAPGYGLVGVAGTWTSLAAIKAGTDAGLDHSRLSRSDVESLIARLAPLSVEETAAVAGLDPARAPVILGGAIVAACALEVLDSDVALVSVRDLLDGLAAEVAHQPT